MNQALEKVKIDVPRSNAFDLSNTQTLSCNMAELVPIMCLECLPGDTIKIGAEALARFAPLVAPIMHPVDLTIHYFFVPNRIVWPGWEDYITNGGDNPGNLPAYPIFKYGAAGVPGAAPYTRLMDYFNLPAPDHATGVSAIPETCSAIPFAAYQKIFNEYYRDQNLISDNFVELQDGDNSATGSLFDLQTRAWGADYFTKALPFAQKGAAVDVPMGDVVLKDETTVPPRFVQLLDHGASNSGGLTNMPGGVPASGIGVDGTPDTPQVYDPRGSLSVDAATINDLRLAYKLQEWLEKNARGGTRYAELIRAHFGTTPQDARLQRPEYITGIKNPIQISEVLNTTGETLPQGNMAGHGISYIKGRKIAKYPVFEHGYIIGIMSIMPKTAYMQGIPKHFTKINHPTEYYWPSFAHLGEQEIYKRELFAFSDQGEQTFGYTPRYIEYKQQPNYISGQFKTSLAYWHMARYFDEAPSLNGAFVTADPTKRIFAVTSTDVESMYVQVRNDVMGIRPMPVFGTPSF